jgi:hypothetical protein
MFAEHGGAHHRAHFHARFGEHEASFAIDPIECIAGSLPKKQQRLVEAWAELHMDELKRDWELLESGLAPQPVSPLQ